MSRKVSHSFWFIFVLIAFSCSTSRPEEETAIPIEVVKPAYKDGTAEMVSRLQQIGNGQNAGNNPYVNSARADALGAQEKQATANEIGSIKFQKGRQLLFAGRVQEAITEFEWLRSAVDQGQLVGNPEAEIEILKHVAIAYLRQAEQDNCISNSTMVSCIFPLQEQAAHKRRDGSQKAIPIYERILKKSPNDLTARWLLNIAHMNLNQYPSQVPAKWLIPPKAFASDYNLPRFRDIGRELNIDVVGLSGGSVTEDLDGDGYLDLMVSSWGMNDQLRFFKNNADGSFTERTSEAGLTGITGGLNLVHADYNNDGYADVLVLRGAWIPEGIFPNSLLMNNGDGTFRDVTVAAGIYSIHPTQNAAWFDFNNDGWLDLFIGNESVGEVQHACEFFVSNGDGTFTEQATAYGLDVRAFIKGCSAADINNDGFQDLYVSNLNGDNFLFKNNGPAADGKFTFSEIAAKAGVTKPFGSFPTWFFDYDNDGFEDIFVSGYSMTRYNKTQEDVAAEYLGLPFQVDSPRLYRNNGNETFTNVTDKAGLNKPLYTMGCNFGDLDNDGYLDFYLGTGEPSFQAVIPNRMFRNDAGKRFQDVTTAGGFGHLHRGHAVSFADIDNDGDQDVHIVMGGAYEGSVFPNLLFENPGTENHWIALALEGAKGPKCAIGSRIKITVKTEKGTRDIYKTVNSGGSFGANSLRQHIGLGAASAIQAVQITWAASGTVQTLTGLEINNFYKVVEGEQSAKVIALQELRLAMKPK